MKRSSHSGPERSPMMWPGRYLAPIRSLGRRWIDAEFWIEHQRRVPGDGPAVEMVAPVEVQPPSDGTGPLNHRRYQVRIIDARLTPDDLIGEFRQDPNRFSPTSFALFAPSPGPEGLTVGDETTVHLPGPWDGPVVVSVAEPGTLRLETRAGHMEAGWIEFTARTEDEVLVFQIESLARSGDSVFDALYHSGRIAKVVQTEMWVRVLEAAVQVSGGRPEGRVFIETTVYERANR